MDRRPFCPRSVQRGTSWCGKEPGVRREEGWAGGQCVCPGPLRTRCQDRIKWARIVSILRKMRGGREGRREPETPGRAIRPRCKVDPSLSQVRARRSAWGIPDCHPRNRKKVQRDRQGDLEAKPAVRGASQEWRALIFLWRGTARGKRGLSPTAKMDFKAQRRALSQFCSLEPKVCELEDSHCSHSRGPGPALSTPWPPGQDSKESENFHSNLALQVILKIFFQGQPTEYILFSSLLYIFKMFSHVVCGSPCILLPGPLKN